MRITYDALTFDDVLLIPAYSNVLPKEASLKSRLSRNIELNLPIVSAAMDTVTEARLAIALAQEGGIGVVHKNMTAVAQAAEVARVKRFESGVIRDPITVDPDISIGKVVELTRSHHISGVPVVRNGNLEGIVTARDLRFVTDMQRSVVEVMTPKQRLVTVEEDAPREQVVKLLHQHRIEKLLVVNKHGALVGMITVKDIEKDRDYPNACKDSDGRLRVAAAVGIGAGTDERVEGLVAAGVDAIVVDTAHGHSERVLQQVAWVKKNFPDTDVIGGNVASGDAARALVDAGADGVKVGIGPGSICTTRMVAGVGVPQISAIDAVATALVDTGVPLIADGGIRYSGDIAKALVAGAWTVMIGNMFAGTDEAPGEIELFQGRSYKSYRGMGSLGAMGATEGSSDRYFQEGTGDADKLVPEGIEGRVPFKGSVVPIVYQLTGGVRSSMGYTGCADLDTFRSRPEFVRITSAGVQESHVHDVFITKEAPNYRNQ
ncbi:MAG: IMP dehydrogenase [Gammaproteobacteria bacterium]|nr:MAG: IMP dehydrogenase [Gammaproteobacteria bacterium]